MFNCRSLVGSSLNDHLLYDKVEGDIFLMQELEKEDTDEGCLINQKHVSVVSNIRIRLNK